MTKLSRIDLVALCSNYCDLYEKESTSKQLEFYKTKLGVKVNRKSSNTFVRIYNSFAREEYKIGDKDDMSVNKLLYFVFRAIPYKVPLGDMNKYLLDTKLDVDVNQISKKEKKELVEKTVNDKLNKYWKEKGYIDGKSEEDK